MNDRKTMSIIILLMDRYFKYIHTSVYAFGYIYVILCVIFRFVIEKEISNCDSNNPKSDVKLTQLSIATIVMFFLTIITLPSLKSEIMLPLAFICIIFMVTTLSLSAVHLFLFDTNGPNVLNCSVSVIAFNVILSLSAFIFGMVLTGAFIFFSCIYIFTVFFTLFVEPIVKRNIRGFVIIVALSWCICQIVLLAIFQCKDFVKGFAITELIIIVLLLRLCCNMNYSEIENWVYLSCILGFLCILIEKIKAGEVTPVSINSCLLFLAPLSNFFFKLISKKEYIDESFVVEMENGPPAICASGSRAVYKKMIFF